MSVRRDSLLLLLLLLLLLVRLGLALGRSMGLARVSSGGRNDGGRAERMHA